MKQVLLSSSSGEQESFVTTDGNAALIVDRFCRKERIWIEKLQYKNNRFKVHENRMVDPDTIARIVIDRDDFLEEVEAS